MKNDTSAIIVSAGNSSRMGGINKQFLKLGNSTVIGMSMKALQNCESIKEIIVVTKIDDVSKIETIAKDLNITKLKCVTIGGSTRQESVLNGSKVISKDTELITIHDGARPLVSPQDIEKCINNARIYGGSTLGVPVKDTIKIVKDQIITDTPYRPNLFITQTPQTFKKSIYFRGVEFAEKNHLDFTDDCQIVEAIGYKVYMTIGHYSNIKITTPEDVSIAEILLKGMLEDNV
ncbi:MAG: 2-C-methyl-D-erythritol 4-phosphate cytidylyltransferase [Oscillospiraceae bacterium]